MTFDESHTRPPRTTQSIPRVPNSTNLKKFFSSHRDDNRRSGSYSRRSVSCASRGPSEDNGSENSQALYMVSDKRRRKSGPSLSSIDNTQGRNLTARKHSSCNAEDRKEAAIEELSWRIIDREIFEWQYVCETGRPYWWSPESKYNTMKSLKPKLSREPSPQIWMREVDNRPKPAYKDRRQAASESNLDNIDNSDTLARMIAVQLLGSCFTLPPNHAIGMPSPNYTAFDKCDTNTLPGPGMISSLRLHTHFRYSPCFGHQPRNPSPAQLWPGTYDGPLSPPPKNDQLEKGDKRNCNIQPKRRRLPRKHNVTELSSLYRCGGSCEGVKHSRDNTEDSVIGATDIAWYRKHNMHQSIPRALTPPHLPSDGRIKAGRSQSLSAQNGRTWPPNSSYRLQPVLRSEPHPVFVQPVRDLIIKPWRTFRRQLRGSLRSGSLIVSEDLTFEASESGISDASSPAISVGGRNRRRRARERGEIHSSVDTVPHTTTPIGGLTPNGLGHAGSKLDWLGVEQSSSKIQAERDGQRIDGTPYYNSSVSGAQTPDERTQRNAWTDSGAFSLGLQSQYPSVTAVMFAISDTKNTSKAQGGSSGMSTASTPGQPPATPILGELTPQRPEPVIGQLQQCPITSITSNNQPASKPLTTPQLKSMQAPPPISYSSIRIPKRHRRRSLLSEVCTPEGFGTEPPRIADSDPSERDALSVVGSALTIPREDDAFVAAERASSSRLHRMSATGTQIFTPDEDGVEVDGLPVGPAKEIWAAKGNRNERTYL